MASFAAVIVTFNPDTRILDRMFAVLDSAGASVIVVDNASSASIVAYLKDKGKTMSCFQLIAFGTNRGIAAAQNAGMLEALGHGAEFVLLLDHDSVPAVDQLNALVRLAGKLSAEGIKLAAVGARLVDPRTGHEYGFARMEYWRWRVLRCGCSDGRIIPCEFINSSGSLISMKAWQDIGPFRDEFFIDHVETDWYMRARARGYRCFGLCLGELEHTMGDDNCRFWFFGWRVMPRRSPRRHYTIVRNALWLYRDSYVPLSWKINNVLKLIFTAFYFSLFDRERGQQFHNILRGVLDGIKGSPGRLNANIKSS